MADFLANIGQIFTAAIGMVGDVGAAIIADPILLTCCGLSIAGIGIGFFKRLANVN